MSNDSTSTRERLTYQGTKEMYDSLHIRNFRGLHELTIHTLSRINLIAGRNNSGKTTLLEAIFLLSGWGNPSLAFTISSIRGISSGSGSLEEIGDFLWKPLFNRLLTDTKIAVSGEFKPLGRLDLRISLGQADTVEIPFGHSGTLFQPIEPDRSMLTFSFSDATRQQHDAAIRLKDGHIAADTPKLPIGFPARFLSSRLGNLQEEANQLGQLRTRKQGELVVDALRAIEPRLKSVEDNSASGQPMIWADVGLPELLPLPVLGEGMNRITRLVLAIASTPDGVVLVDEIENGLHHSALKKVWKTIERVAEQSNTQVFATTHSYECVVAAHAVLSQSDFVLHRLDANKTGVRCISYDHEEREAAVRHNLEVR